MEHLIIAAYITPTHINQNGDDERTKIWETVNIEKSQFWHIITHSTDVADLDPDQHTYQFIYYAAAPALDKNYKEELIIEDIKKRIQADKKILILLHTGTKPGFTRYISNFENDKVNLVEFSGGNGEFYKKVINSQGRIFPSLNSTDIPHEKLPILYQEIWNHFSPHDEHREIFEKSY